MESMTKYLFKVLEEIRVQQELTQEEFAAKLGITRTHYQYCLYGQRGIKFDTMYMLCDELGIHINEIISRAENLKLDIQVENRKTA